MLIALGTKICHALAAQESEVALHACLYRPPGAVPAVALLIISTSGFFTGNAALRCRWFDGENDGCRSTTMFTVTSVPGISTPYATVPRLPTRSSQDISPKSLALRLSHPQFAKPFIPNLALQDCSECASDVLNSSFGRL